MQNLCFFGVGERGLGGYFDLRKEKNPGVSKEGGCHNLVFCETVPLIR